MNNTAMCAMSQTWAWSCNGNEDKCLKTRQNKTAQICNLQLDREAYGEKNLSITHNHKKIVHLQTKIISSFTLMVKFWITFFSSWSKKGRL